MAAGLEARAASTAGEVLMMRADILLDIIGGRARLLRRGSSGGAGGGGGGRVEADGDVVRGSDGTKRVKIKSMASLAAFFSGQMPGGVQ